MPGKRRNKAPKPASPNVETRQVPMLATRAAVMPESIDLEAREATFVASTGHRDLRRPFYGEDYYEELEISEKAIRLGRFETGAPLLDSHRSYAGVSGILGVVERAWIEAGKLMTRVRFSTREEVEPIFRDVVNGIIRSVSVGYRVHTWEKSRQDEDELMTMRAVDWEPAELSLVPVGFDPGAQVRGQEDAETNSVQIIDLTQRAAAPTNQPEGSAMDLEQRAAKLGLTRRDGETDEQLKARIVAAEQRNAPAAVEPQGDAPTAATTEDAQRIAQEAISAERQRAKEISRVVRTAGLHADFGMGLIDRGASIDEARAAVIDELARLQEGGEIRTQVRVETSPAHIESQRAALVDAIRHRANPSHKIDTAAREFAGMTLLRVAEECLSMNGVSTRGLSKRQIVERALTTSDFANIMADVTNKELRQGYTEQRRTFELVFRRRTAADFKNINIVQLSSAPDLVTLNENGEFKSGTLTDGKETYKLITYGRLINLTRQTVINDDLDALTRVPNMFGASGARRESDVVWGIFTANAALADGTALFHADHNNTLAAGAINATNVGALRKLMRKQTGLQGEVLDIQPEFLLAGPDKELELDQFFGTFMPNAQTSVTPSNLRSLTPVVEARLTGNNWYLAANHSQIDTIEYAYLEGEEGVYTETKQGFEVDGVQIKARLDFAAKAVDHRGLARNGS